MSSAAPDCHVLISDPLFRRGYAEIWRGAEPRDRRDWSAAERLAYERGRRFGALAAGLDEGYLPLSTHGGTDPAAAALLVRALRSGEL